MVKLLDCTTRDGGFTSNWNFEDEYVYELINCLNKSRIDYYEIGYRNSSEIDDKGQFFSCSNELLEKFSKHKENLKLGIMVDVRRFNINEFSTPKNDKIDFIRIACHPQEIEQALQIAEKLHIKGYKIFVQLMEALKLDAEGFIQLFQWQHKNILESIYIADSYGEMTPTNVEQIFNKLKVIGYEKISFHAHNNFGLALENTLKAIDIGAYSVDITHNGIGRGGNLDAKILLEILDGYCADNYANLDNVLLKN